MPEKKYRSNRYQVLTVEQVREIRERYIHGLKTNVLQLSQEYGISQAQCREIAKGKSWVNV
jgi:hypothetical protein